MFLFFVISLFLFGSIFGSFASVLIHRLKTGEGGIVTGRSHCPHCNTTLQAYDLVPLFSFLSTGGKCRYCKKSISPIYPLLEVSTGLVFSLMGIFLVDSSVIASGDLAAISHMVFLLLIGYITILYIFYDILFMEIHEGIMGVGIALAFVGNIIASYTVSGFQQTALLAMLCLFILVLFYIIMLKELKEIYDIGLIFLSIAICFLVYNHFPALMENPVFSGLVGALGIFVFFYLQIFLSKGRALGGGDLRIGIMIGLLLGASGSIMGIILSYIVGSIIGIFILIRDRKKQGPSEVPFGPFLGIGFLLTFLFSEQIQGLLQPYMSFL